MARVRGPLFSLSATGTIRGGISYSRRKGGPVVSAIASQQQPTTPGRFRITTHHTFLSLVWTTFAREGVYLNDNGTPYHIPFTINAPYPRTGFNQFVATRASQMLSFRTYGDIRQFYLATHPQPPPFFFAEEDGLVVWENNFRPLGIPNDAANTPAETYFLVLALYVIILIEARPDIAGDPEEWLQQRTLFPGSTGRVIRDPDRRILEQAPDVVLLHRHAQRV